MANKKEESQVPTVAENQEEKNMLPATVEINEFEQDAEMGLQGVNADDMAIPFLSIIQSGSPQRKKTDGKYIQGAEEGHAFNTVTNELFTFSEGPLIIVPCAFERYFLQWHEREGGGGGLVAIHKPDSEIVKQAKREGSKDMLPDGTYLSNTAQHYCLLVYPDGTWKRIVVSMSSTQLKKSRRFLTMIGEKTMKSGNKIFTPPSFAFKYFLSTIHESNDKGDWHGWKIEEGPVLNLQTEKSLYEAAKKFSKAVLAGAIKTAAPPEAEAGAPPRKDDLDDEIPF
jgi:hypothetical protein